MALAWLPLLLVAVQAQSGPTPIDLFDGDFEQWVVEQATQDAANSTFPSVHNDAVLISRSSGWIHTRTPYANFRLSVDFRPDTHARAALHFRTWAGVDATGKPKKGYEVALEDPRATGEWRRLVLECRGDRATVSIDGDALATFTGLENSSGYLGFRGETGVVWVRNARLVDLDPPASDRLIAERAGPGTGVTLPVLILDVKSRYSVEAMRRRITGTVRLEALVRADGTVGDVQVLRSIDAKYGMDQECVDSVRQWRFRPGMKNGVTVPVIVSIDMAFTLK